MKDFAELVPLLQGGGNLSLVICCYFLWKVERRLTALESTLRVFLSLLRERKQ